MSSRRIAALKILADETSSMLVLCLSGKATMAEKKAAAFKVTMMGASGQLVKLYVRHSDWAELITLGIGAGTLAVLGATEALKAILGGLGATFRGGTRPQPHAAPANSKPWRPGDDAKRVPPDEPSFDRGPSGTGQDDAS